MLDAFLIFVGFVVLVGVFLAVLTSIKTNKPTVEEDEIVITYPGLDDRMIGGDE